MATDAAANIISLYQRHAVAWAKLRGTHFWEGKGFEAFINLLPANPTILDIGCGSGAPIAKHLLGLGCHVTGIDASPELIDIAKTNNPEGTWHVHDMRSLNLRQKFDGILAWHSAFHLTQSDQRNMFEVYNAHAAPNAALMFTSGTSDGIAMGEFEGEPLFHASLDPGEYRDLLHQNGFEVIDHMIENPDCGGATIWLARRNGTTR